MFAPARVCLLSLWLKAKSKEAAQAAPNAQAAPLAAAKKQPRPKLPPGPADVETDPDAIRLLQGHKAEVIEHMA